MRQRADGTRRKTLRVRLRPTETQPTYDLGAEGWARVAEGEDKAVDNRAKQSWVPYFVTLEARCIFREAKSSFYPLRMRPWAD